MYQDARFLLTIQKWLSPSWWNIVTNVGYKKNSSSVTCISKKKYKTRTNEWHTAWINPRVPSLGVNTERHFFPVVFHFIKHTETTKEDSANLVLDGHYSCTRNLEIITVARKNRAFRAGYLLLLSGLAKFKVPGQIWWLSGKVKGWCLNITMCFDSVYLTPFT